MCGGVRFKYDERLEPALAKVYSGEQLEAARAAGVVTSVFWQAHPVLPALIDGDLQLFDWGNRDEALKLPKTGWVRAESLEAGAEELLPQARRGARYRCAMVFVRGADDPAPVIAEASWEGSIDFGRRGNSGFGYDPLFVVAGTDVTVAGMPEEEKNRASHRGKAMVELAEKMRSAGW